MNQITSRLKKISQLIRYYILTSTTNAGSGHPTSSLSATDLMTTLFFSNFFKYDIQNPNNPNNDRLIFSKGHASPLLYALWAVAGGIKSQELTTLRKFNSRLEGHPTPNFPYTKVATGSLGQGLSIGVGMAINAKYLDNLPYHTYVLLGDSEMAEGSNWEAIQIASYYELNNLIGIIDVNRLGQRGETMDSYNLNAYEKKISSFGWKTLVIDGHDFNQIKSAFKQGLKSKNKPVMIIAKTIKGKGISFLENKENWHGKCLNKDQLKKALLELGKINKKIKEKLSLPKKIKIKTQIIKKYKQKKDLYKKGLLLATRKAYGQTLVKLFPQYPNIVVLDAETSNSTYAQTFKNSYPDHFFEMFIAEQNMVGTAVGLSKLGKIPFISTFSAFFSRAFDQIRMSQYSQSNIKFVGSHGGVSIGQDGSSQMGLEDIAMFRTINNSVVLYPADGVSTEKLIEQAIKHQGIVYLRTTRMDTPIIYQSKETFKIGGSKTLKKSNKDMVTIVSAGITIYEALKAYKELKNQGILVRVIDLYSIKPLDYKTLLKATSETKAILTVEDHYPQGGIGESVNSALSKNRTPIYSLAVKKMPQSGQPKELLDYEEISSNSIIKKVNQILKQ